MVDQKEGPAALGFRDYQLNTRTKNVKCKSLRKRVNLCIIHDFHVFKRDHVINFHSLLSRFLVKMSRKHKLAMKALNNCLSLHPDC